MSHPIIALGLPLLAAHLLGDFVFQGDKAAAEKGRLPVLARHSAVHAVLAYVLVGWWAAWWVPAGIGVAHGLIDFVKARASKGTARAFFVDQTAHLITLAGFARWWGGGGGLSRWAAVLGHRFDRILIVTIGGVLCVRAAGVVIGYWVKPYLEEIRERAREVGGLDVRMRGLTRGGWVIGQWERALIFLFVGMGQLGAIGFLIAAKSIFRFGELRDPENRMEAEYITIGTLMSFGVAVAVSFATFWLARRI